MNLTRVERIDIIAFAYIAIYFIIGIFTLTSFPLVFTDEPWLSEPSYNFIKNGTMRMMSFPNYGNELVHNGIIFMLLNVITIWLFGFTLFAVRLFPFLFFIGSLLVLYLLLRKLFDKKLALPIMVLVSIHPFTVNASRLMRTEVFVFFFFLFGIYIIHNGWKEDCKKMFIAGLVCSLAILNHLVGLFSLMAGLVIAAIHFPPNSQEGRKKLLYFIIGTVPALAVFSLNLYSNFPFYRTMGSSEGLFSMDLISKLLAFASYLLKGFDFSLRPSFQTITLIIILFISFLGVLRMPRDMKKFYLGLASAFIIVSLFLFALSHNTRLYLVYFLILGILVLLIPIFYFDSGRKAFLAISLALGSFFIYQDLLWINYFRGADYLSFEKELREPIPAGSRVVGKINFRLSFPDCEYYAAEDMSKYIKRGLGDFEGYIKKYKIEYIIYDYSWAYQSSIGNTDGHGTPFEKTMEFLEKKTDLIANINERYYSNKFGPAQASHAHLPFYNLVELGGNGSPNETYWTRIYRVRN